jgi:hypothetical protein
MMVRANERPGVVQWIAGSTFPAPLKIEESRAAWRASVIAAWLAQQARAAGTGKEIVRAKKEPLQEPAAQGALIDF